MRARTWAPAQYQSTAQLIIGACRDTLVFVPATQAVVSISGVSVPKENRFPVVRSGTPKYTFSQEWETAAPAAVEDRTTRTLVAPAGATPATPTRCHDADAVAVGSDHRSDPTGV
ncbi:hypothetical protein OG402_34165 [Streptomyces anulatus]|uniref:hypothetical protein n=1 Tax=Streptomyces anulatus TaxID=1892 RepID=UPI002256EBDA|nr:hypothetical protein [Streptomyces anulatus]MCX4605516.1 hypothetical protein [Streptomyces anulatus]